MCYPILYHDCFFLIFVSTFSAQELEQLQLEKEPRIYPELHLLALRALVSPGFIQTYLNIFKLSIPKEEHIFWVSPGETGESSQFGFEEKRSSDLDDKSLEGHSICNGTSIAACVSMALAYVSRVFTPVPV